MRHYAGAGAGQRVREVGQTPNQPPLVPGILEQTSGRLMVPGPPGSHITFVVDQALA